MAVSQKIKSGDDQPNGGEGIVSIGGARGLTAANKISANHQVSPFPPLLPSQMDWSVAVADARLNTRFDDTNYYHGSGSYGGPS